MLKFIWIFILGSISYCLPVWADEDTGKILYESQCAVCHGADAKASGPLAQKNIPPTPDLTSPAFQKRLAEYPGIIVSSLVLRPNLALLSTTLKDNNVTLPPHTFTADDLRALNQYILTLIKPTPHASTFNLIGTWKLLSTEEQDQNGTWQPQCHTPTGILIYAASGYMAVAVNCMRAENSKTPSFTPQDMTFYAGQYSLQQDKVIHFVQNSSDPAYYGKALVRKIKILDTNKIILIVNGTKHLVQLTWQRIN